jgi:hypothetical protein
MEKEFISHIANKQWLKQHVNKFGEIVSKISEFDDKSTIYNLFENMYEILSSIEKHPAIELTQIVYLNNKNLYNKLIRDVADSIVNEKLVESANCDGFYKILIGSYIMIFKICGENHKYSKLTDGYFNDTIHNLEAGKGLFSSILRNENLTLIKSIINMTLFSSDKENKCILSPEEIRFHASFNPNPDVIKFIDENY